MIRVRVTVRKKVSKLLCLRWLLAARWRHTVFELSAREVPVSMTIH